MYTTTKSTAAPCSAAQWRERWDGGLAAPATECAVFRAPCSLHVTTLVAVSALDPLRSNVGFSVDRPLRSVVDLNELRGVGGGARVTYLYATDAHGTVLLLPHHPQHPPSSRSG